MNTNAEILNSVRGVASDGYRAAVPYANGQNAEEIAAVFADNNFITYNEFINTLVNKILVQRLFDPGDWSFPFKEFIMETDPYGDAQELIGIDVADGTQYTEASSLLTVVKPSVYVNYVKTTSKTKWQTSFSYEIVKGAMLREYGLAQLAGTFMRRMRYKADKGWYDQTLTDLATIPYSEVVGNPSTDDAAKTVMTNIIRIVSDMSLPNKSYNAGNYDMALPLGNAILILNSQAKANLDVRVFATLLNSQKINNNNYFRNVYIANFADTNVLGYIVEASSYIIAPRINQTSSFFDSSNLVTQMFLHVWTRQGLNPESQMCKLLIAQPTADENKTE